MDLIKNLTGKNPADYEPVAATIINNADVELFKELVSRDDYLFDFVKQNVAQRLSKACNKSNFKNLYKFLDIYSPYYDEFISSTLAQFSDETVEDYMLNVLENCSEDAKTYSASYFSYVPNTKALSFLRANAYSENTNLAVNCAVALSKLNDRECYNVALDKLKSNDSFEQYSAVKFLVNYQDKSALGAIFEAMKNSMMAENIAGEIPYLASLTELINTDFQEDAILAFCYILNGLAELISIAQVIDFDFYNLISQMIKSSPNGAIAVALLMAKEKFETFVENEEYLFDEDKNTKNEVNDINILLKNIDTRKYESFVFEELYEESAFVFFAMDLIKDKDSLAELLEGQNQTVILKAMSILKNLGHLSSDYKSIGLNNISDENIKQVALAL